MNIDHQNCILLGEGGATKSDEFLEKFRIGEGEGSSLLFLSMKLTVISGFKVCFFQQLYCIKIVLYYIVLY